MKVEQGERRFGCDNCRPDAGDSPKECSGSPESGERASPFLRKLREGAREADLLDAYPGLTAEDIKAAIGYAAETAAHEETVLVATMRKRATR